MNAVAARTTALVTAALCLAAVTTGCASTTSRQRSAMLIAAGAATVVAGGFMMAHEEDCESRSLFGGDTGSSYVTETYRCRPLQTVARGALLALAGTGVTVGGFVWFVNASDDDAERPDLTAGAPSREPAPAPVLGLPGAHGRSPHAITLPSR
jgi:hypothetical protein